MKAGRWRAWARKPWVVGAGVAVAVAALVGGWSGVVVGLVAGFGVHRWLAVQPSGTELARRQRLQVDLPFAIDLLAAALRAGSPPDVAAQCVSDAMSGPMSERLGRVARALRLGAPADEAWAYLGDGDAAVRVARAAVRSQHSGAALAATFERLADDLRGDLLGAADAAARRAGVLIVLPLGLCFLPAFVLAGLVPVLVAVAGDVLSG
jgi:pilus assembly protein TadC